MCLITWCVVVFGTGSTLTRFRFSLLALSLSGRICCTKKVCNFLSLWKCFLIGQWLTGTFGPWYCSLRARCYGSNMETPDCEQLHFVHAIKSTNKYIRNKSKNTFVPDSGSLRLTGGSSSSDSSSSSCELRFVSESPLSLLRLTILRNEGRLRLSSSFSVVRSPVGRLSLRSLSLRRPANLRKEEKSFRIPSQQLQKITSLRNNDLCITDSQLVGFRSGLKKKQKLLNANIAT